MLEFFFLRCYFFIELTIKTNSAKLTFSAESAYSTNEKKIKTMHDTYYNIT